MKTVDPNAYVGVSPSVSSRRPSGRRSFGGLRFGGLKPADYGCLPAALVALALCVPAVHGQSKPAAKPVVSAGFKAYISPRAFFRGDILISPWTTSRDVTVRGGIGVDLN